MGQHAGKEARTNDPRLQQSGLGEPSTYSSAQHGRHQPGTRGRLSRGDLTFLAVGNGASSSSHPEPPYERRETKQEREARRLERDRIAREKERVRSMKEEHVDGGFLVTLGTYTGIEDFSKPTVRQLQIERKIAPFWRGLQDVSDTWTEHQLVAAARGLPIPPADEPPPDDLIPRPLSPASPPSASNTNLNKLTVPIDTRSQSFNSEQNSSNPSSSLPSPVTPSKTSSPFKPRARALAAALISSRNASQTDLGPREINLPHDPFVNGQPIEVFLYKEASECPICFLCYPPYLNRTRCCDQPICSECFVQIKRPDPHLPEHHGEPGEPPQEAKPDEQLISEPACCPYCQQPEFGVTYEPPPFRRGLAYANPPSGVGSMGIAMSSSSSLNSTATPTLSSPPIVGRRRTQSLSVNAPGVITTDRVRPDWSTKLEALRAHQARRAAAATALHTATFLMGNNESRSLFGRSGRLSRRQTGGSTGQNTPTNGNTSEVGSSGLPQSGAPSDIEPGPRGSSGRPAFLSARRVEDLEELMLMEAMRLSLADEEDRRRKAEKEARKEAKKKEKEDRKAAKSQFRHNKNDLYGSPSGSNSGSSLSLGRKRGNSAASNLRIEASVASAMSIAESSGSNPPSAVDKGKGVDRLPVSEAESSTAGTPSLPIPTPGHHSPGPSHLRQMSNASSISSSLADSPSGSYAGPGMQGPRSSGLSLSTQDGEGSNGDGMEPLFNFRSLAEMVGVQIDSDHTSVARRDSDSDGMDEAGKGKVENVENGGKDGEKASTNGVDTSESNDEPAATTASTNVAANIDTPDSRPKPPHLIITPDTPALLSGEDEVSKRLESDGVMGQTVEITQ